MECGGTRIAAERTHTAKQPRHVTTSYVYDHDGAGRLETGTTGDQTTTFAYDAAGNRASVKNPNLGATVNAGDDTNRVPVSVKFAYNGHGELPVRRRLRGDVRLQRRRGSRR